MASMSAEGALQSSGGYGVTKLVLEKCSLTWVIENISYFNEDEYIRIESPTFLPSSKSKFEWSIILLSFFKGNGARLGPKTMMITFCSRSARREFTKVKCCASFQDGKGCEFYQVTKWCGLWEEAWETPDWETKDWKLLTDMALKFLVDKIGENDILKIQMEITCVGEALKETRKEKDFYGRINSQNKHIEDFSNLFLQQKFGDVVIAVRNTEFQAHQAILIARSPVLAAMLTHDTKEKRQKRIEINDVAPEIMKKLLHFMYSGNVAPNSIDVALPLLTAADKYALDDLKDHCAGYLISQLDSSNVIDVLNVADIHNMPHLKTKALDCISANKVEFANMQNYPGLKNPQLKMEIVARLTNN